MNVCWLLACREFQVIVINLSEMYLISRVKEQPVFALTGLRWGSFRDAGVSKLAGRRVGLTSGGFEHLLTPFLSLRFQYTVIPEYMGGPHG